MIDLTAEISRRIIGIFRKVQSQNDTYTESAQYHDTSIDQDYLKYFKLC